MNPGSRTQLRIAVEPSAKCDRVMDSSTGGKAIAGSNGARSMPADPENGLGAWMTKGKSFATFDENASRLERGREGNRITFPTARRRHAAGVLRHQERNACDDCC